MNPQSNLSGSGSNSNSNQELGPHLSTELLERLLPSFPLSVAGRDPDSFPRQEVNNPQEGGPHNGVVDHPLIQQAGTSTSRTSQGSQGMNNPGAATSSRPQNYHNQVQISASGTPPDISYGTPTPIHIPPAESRSRLPDEAPSFLDNVFDGGTPIFRIRDLIGLGESLFNRRVSVARIMQHMERETITYVNEEDPNDEREKCPICLEEFADGDEIGKLHLCMHKYHVHCIVQWLSQSNVCPMCRRTALNTNNNI